MGAFLQSIIYGFAGVRIRPDSLEFHDPQPPPSMTSIVMTGFQYLGSNLTFTITTDTTTIKVNSVGQQYPLILRRNATGAVEESLTAGKSLAV